MSAPRMAALLRRLLWVGAAGVAVFSLGVAGYMLLEGWGFGDAVYMTAITMTTVGFKEVQPLDESGRWFTIAIALLGVMVALVGVTLAAASWRRPSSAGAPGGDG